MSKPTRGLSWVSETAASLIRDFRNTSERLGFRGAVSTETWGEIEDAHIRASSALCHFIADLEQSKTVNARKSQRRRRSGSTP